MKVKNVASMTSVYDLYRTYSYYMQLNTLFQGPQKIYLSTLN